LRLFVATVAGSVARSSFFANKLERWILSGPQLGLRLKPH
jgi:hypothetical protein